MSSQENDETAEDPDPAILSIPDRSTVPAAGAGRSARSEYDSYFRLARDNPGLLDWSRSCLPVLQRQLSGLGESKLSEDDRVRIMEGVTAVLQIVLEKWVDALSTAERQQAG